MNGDYMTWKELGQLLEASFITPSRAYNMLMVYYDNCKDKSRNPQNIQQAMDRLEARHNFHFPAHKTDYSNGGT